jgi:hypothetical protein
LCVCTRTAICPGESGSAPIVTSPRSAPRSSRTISAAHASAASCCAPDFERTDSPCGSIHTQKSAVSEYAAAGVLSMNGARCRVPARTG